MNKELDELFMEWENLNSQISALKELMTFLTLVSDLNNFSDCIPYLTSILEVAEEKTEMCMIKMKDLFIEFKEAVEK